MLQGSFFVRHAHRSRFKLALALVLERNPLKVIDFGAGNGYFVSILRERNITSACGYDPLSDEPDILKRIDDVEGKYDCITCLEVLEHLNEEQTAEFFSFVGRHLENDGFVIISVPVMIGPAGALKVLKEKWGSNFYNQEKYTYKAAFRALIGRPEMTRYFNSQGIFRHLNWDHRNLEKQLATEFSGIQRLFSPLKILPAGLNSQVFYVCNKRSSGIDPYSSIPIPKTRQ